MVGPKLCGIMLAFWDNQEVVTSHSRYYVPQFCVTCSTTRGVVGIAHALQRGFWHYGQTLALSDGVIHSRSPFYTGTFSRPKFGLFLRGLWTPGILVPGVAEGALNIII